MINRNTAARRLTGAAAIIALLALGAAAPAVRRAPMPAGLLAGLRWRNVGPFRGGRVSAVTGAIGEPGTFYMGLVLGGVWKTTSGGMTWYPVFDSIKDVSSIGSVEVAPSDPDIVYVGTGSTGDGNGIYKSTDAGRTWRHLPELRESRQIPAILVDPHNPDVVLAAVLGDARTAGDSRGLYRSTDGGGSWTRPSLSTTPPACRASPGRRIIRTWCSPARSAAAAADAAAGPPPPGSREPPRPPRSTSPPIRA